jgi:hypothetical protein
MRTSLLVLVIGIMAGCVTDSSDPNNCSCDISSNGVSKTLACGTSDCVNGQTYSCGDTADVTSGGTCTSSSGSDSGSSSIDCYGKTCNSATQYCILSAVGQVTLGSSCAPLPSGCSSCDCLGDVEAAWKSLDNDTNNCTGAVEYCSAHNGAATVTCQK